MKVITDLFKSINSRTHSFVRKDLANPHPRSMLEMWGFPALLLVTAALGVFIIAMIGMKPSWSYLGSPTKTKTAEMAISSVRPAIQPSGGTMLEAVLTASGFIEQQAGKNVTGINLEACVTNYGEAPTQNLAILAVIQTKTGQKDYVNYQMAMVDVSSKPVLEPSESHCYPARILFDPVEGASYRASLQATITNYSGWVAGSANCPGPVPCAIGDQVKTDFTLASQPYTSSSPGETIINGTLTASGYGQSDLAGVKGQACITNTGFELTLDLTIHNQVLYTVGGGTDYQEVIGAEQIITPGQQLGSRETQCYPYQMAFSPIPGAHYRAISWIAISNYTGWLPGGKNCTGPVPCMTGIQLQSDFNLPFIPSFLNQTPSSTPSRTPTTGLNNRTPTSSSTPTSTGTPPPPPNINPSETVTPWSTYSPTEIPTIRPTATYTPSPKPAPSETRANTPTPPPSATWTPRPSDTPSPTELPTQPPTITNTPVPSEPPILPTDTPVPPTDTAVPPTDTAEPPSKTPGPPPTKTPEPTLPDPSATPSG